MQVTLKKDGWHRRLQEFTFDNPIRFTSLCPYFWFTIFCIIVLPFTLIVKGCKTLARKIDDGLDWVDEKICAPVYESQLLSLSDEDLYLLWQNDLDISQGRYTSNNYEKLKKGSKRFRRFKEAWLKRHRGTYAEFEENILESLKAYREKMEARLEQERKEKEIKEEKRKQMFVNIAKYTKWLAPAFAIAIVGAIVYGVYCLLVWAAGAWKPAYWHVVIGGLIGAVGIVVLVDLIIAIVKFLRKCDTKIIGGAKMGKFTGKIGSAFGSFFSFIASYIKAAKENYCPMINWD